MSRKTAESLSQGTVSTPPNFWKQSSKEGWPWRTRWFGHLLHVGLFWKLQDLSATRLKAPELLPSRFFWEGFLSLSQTALPKFLRWLLTVFISFSAVTFSIKHKLLEFLNTGRNSSKCYPCQHNPGGCLSKNPHPKPVFSSFLEEFWPFLEGCYSISSPGCSTWRFLCLSGIFSLLWTVQWNQCDPWPPVTLG